METVIEARSLVKRYGNKNVVDGIHFHVNKGECFGILGPNGAGKSTTMKMMYGSSYLSAGELFILGLNVKKNPQKIKAKIGVVPQENGLDPDFSVMENLLIFSKYYGIPNRKAKTKCGELLRFMHLEDYDGRPVEELSGGMQRRLTIARSLLGDPQLLFLDEPTTGLDPQARFWIWESLEQLKANGKSLVLTTHYMEEAERMCDRIAIMDKGKILAEGKPQELIEEHIGHEVVEFSVNIDELEYYLQKIRDKFSYQVLNNKVRLFIKTGQDGRTALDQITSDNILVRKSSLDDVFLKLAGHNLSLEL